MNPKEIKIQVQDFVFTTSITKVKIIKNINRFWKEHLPLGAIVFIPPAGVAILGYFVSKLTALIVGLAWIPIAYFFLPTLKSPLYETIWGRHRK